jgi:hypothetical protein
VAIRFERPSPALIVACIALVVALGPAVHAANTVFSSDIVDGEVKTADLADQAVTFAKMAPNSVRSANVVDQSLTAADFKGANVKGALLNLPAGSVANGRCRNVIVQAAGAVAGDAVIISLMAAAPAGMHFSGVSAGPNRILLQVCNLTGAPSPAISSLPLRVVTIG